MIKILFKSIIFLILFTLTGINIAFAAPKINFSNGVFHIILDGKAYAKKIKFISNPELISNKDIHKLTKSKLTINTGYFDPKNQKTISYIVSERSVTTEDPLFNENLLNNKTLMQNLPKILNRTEFRVLECNGKYSYSITPHSTPVDFECSIETSAQGGPMILPELRLEEEFFVVRNSEGEIIRDSISAYRKCARTIIGLKDGDVHIVIITNDNPMTLPEAQDYCKNLGLEYAMNFDGGSSTSLNYKKTIEVVSTRDAAGRLLKSFMIVK